VVFLPEDHRLAVRSMVKEMVSRNSMWRMSVAARPNNRRPDST